jgi:hypothetical protein
MYSSDQAIENIEEDLLGRAAFATYLSKTICEYSGSESLVIGLFGKWGTGKTSVINMAIKQVEKASNETTNKPMIVKFSPWNYSDKDNLISLFFKCLKGKLSKDENRELKEKIGKALNDYAGAFDALAAIPLVGDALATVLKTLVQAKGNELSGNIDLEDSKQILDEVLRKCGQKIIVVIDDIDRLDNTQIRDIFQLVKQVADFPNVIYLLAMDRDVVARALEDVHKYDGNEYLEKIIQIPFTIPELNKENLYKIFLTRLNDTISKCGINVDIDKEYWNQVLEFCVKPFLKTMRDVNRVINIFYFKLSMVRREVCIEDVIALSVLEATTPNIYQWISHNKDAVCGSTMHSLRVMYKQTDSIRREYLDTFKTIGADEQITIKCIATLFPVFAKDVNENNYDYYSHGNIRERRRVAQEERFNLYFALNLDEIKVPNELIENCVKSYDEDEIIQVINEVNKDGNAVFLINELQARVEKIPKDRLITVARSLYRTAYTLKGEEAKSIFGITSYEKAVYLIDSILEKLGKSANCYELFKAILEKGNVNEIGVLSRTIYKIESLYGRVGNNEETQKDTLITIEELDKIEKLFADTMKAVEKDLILQSEGFWSIWFLWQYVDGENSQKFISSILEDDTNCLRFVCKMAGQWTGSNGRGWSFHLENYKEYITDERIVEILNRYDKKKMISEFSEVDLVKLASFECNYKKEKMYHANEEQAMDKVKEWREECD